MINPIMLHVFADDTPPAWATFYTSVSSPNPVKITVRIPVGEKSFFDFGDGSGVLVVDGNGTDQLVQKTYSTPVAGTKIKISFSNKSLLERFYCNSNQLTGSIPTLAGLNSLARLTLYSNQLTGSIPTLTGLTSLTYLYLYNNQLTGSIPTLTGLTSLAHLYLYDNPLTGSIPSLTGLTSLVRLYIYNCPLTGSIPSLTGLTSLNILYLYNNQLTGFDGGMAGGSRDLISLLNDNDLSGAAVNLILADSVTEGLVTGDEIDLSGGTNAAPTGQGITDKATLIAAGVSVTTN